MFLSTIATKSERSIKMEIIYDIYHAKKEGWITRRTGDDGPTESQPLWATCQIDAVIEAAKFWGVDEIKIAMGGK